jgi:hypothetical protein
VGPRSRPGGRSRGVGMSRLRRFEHCRYVGVRDTMRVYDQDDESQSAELERRVAEGDLVNRTLLQTFAPDTLEEARNRGFRAR